MDSLDARPPAGGARSVVRGASRLALGLDPDSPYLAPLGGGYNAAITDGRIDEIARMLSGEAVTDGSHEVRAAVSRVVRNQREGQQNGCGQGQDREDVLPPALRRH